MNFFDLVNISERYMELVNPSTPQKVLTIGKALGLKEGSRVIEFGCGYGEVLALWAKQFGACGTGIDIREHACNRAKKKMSKLGLTERIDIICANAAKHPLEKQAFAVAACVGASFIWGGYRPTIRAMKEVIHPKGKLVIGEPYWLREQTPPEYVETQQVHTEHELWQIAREEAFDFEYVVRASHDDWDRYEADNWYGLIRWLEENPEHPEHQEVIDHLHKAQDEYFRYGREYMGWAIYVLSPAKY